MPAGKPQKGRLKLITGMPANTDAPIPDDDGLPYCPSGDPQVQAIWDDVVPQVSRMRILSAADRDLLHTYCEAVVQYRRCGDVLAREGMFIKPIHEGSASVAHPLVRTQSELAKTMQRLATEFGLTPAARSKIKVGDSAPAQSQGAARLLSS